MSEQQSRRNFLKALGLTGVATLAGGSLFTALAESPEVLKLNPQQKEFMLENGKWMDDFIEVIRIQKSEPANMDNQKKMIALAEQAEVWKPQLTEYMNDRNFALIYHASIQSLRDEIEG